MGTTTVQRYAAGRAREVELLDVASSLFAERDFGGVSLRDIAARTGISHASVLRYYPSKDAILRALLDRWEQGNIAFSREHPELRGPELTMALARRNDAVPGYVELFAVLAGEATPSQHPAHDHFARRYRDLRGGFDNPGQAPEPGLSALWDGLQIMSLYIDELQVPDELAAFLGGAGAPRRAWELPESPADVLGREAGAGYSKGRRRRAEIVRSASELFAERGFLATSLSEIARHAGVSKSTLVHHIGTKNNLLASVLQARDHAVIETFDADGGMRLSDLVTGSRLNELSSGLVELYTVMVCEATSPLHPAHDYFSRRYRNTVSRFAELMRAEAPGIPDPLRSATWFVATWDGLQIQWLYDRDAVDVPGTLARLLADLSTRD